MNKLIIALDSQRLGALDCMFRFDMRFNKNIDVAETSSAISKGSFFHELLRYYYLGRKLGKATPTEIQGVETLVWDGDLDTDLNFRGFSPYDSRDQAIPLARKRLPEIGLDDDFLITEVIATFQEYVDFYASCTWKVISVEQPFSVILYEDDVVRVVKGVEYSGLTIVWEGIIDLEVENTQGEIFPVDHKTSSRRNYPESLVNQFLGYAFKSDQKLVCVNQVEFKKGADKFHRPFLVYPNYLVNRWCESVIDMVLMRYIPSLNLDHWPRNFHACNQKFKCVYTDFCEADEQSQRWLLKTKYQEVKPWDPFGRDE